MRTFITCFLSFALVAGCTNSSGPDVSQLMPRNADNTWTSDALQRGDSDAIRDKARENSSYIHERDFVGDTPLLTAIAFADLDLVQFLLRHGADPNVEVNDGYTCLLTAIESDADESTPIVAELIRAGADIHAIGTNGWTPLHMAAARGQVEKARLLIDAGADVNRRKEIDASETPVNGSGLHGTTVDGSPVACARRQPVHARHNNRTPLEIAEDAAKGP